MKRLILAAALLASPVGAETLTTGDLGLIVERETGSLVVIDQSERAAIGHITGLGDLSHAAIVYSPDERFAFVFGRDGGLTKIDMTTQAIAGRVMQSGNSIGGAISDDGRLIAVANYEPGGLKVFDADTLALIADFPTQGKVVGLEDAQDRRFAFSVWDTGESWLADFSGARPVITRLGDSGAFPYDALIDENGRNYIVGLFGEKGLTAYDLWQDSPAPQKLLPDYGKDQEDLPVYKMPHLEGWAQAAGQFVLPAVGLHEILWVDGQTMQETGRTKTHGQPVFAMARPGGRQVWVNFAHPLNDTIQVVDSLSHEVIHQMTPGPAILHMEFTARGNEVWVSVRDAGRVEIYDATSFEKLGEVAAQSPSGIFFTSRAHRLGL